MMRAAADGGVVVVTVAVVDPAFETDAALGFGAGLEVVEELVCESTVETLSLAVGLGPIGPGPAMHDASLGEQLGEGVGDEVRAVVGEGLVHGHVVGPEPIPDDERVSAAQPHTSTIELTTKQDRLPCTENCSGLGFVSGCGGEGFG